ncbi:50S ribosomal protein L6 [Candidatus Woesearchaeota archaeon]|nr:50S ribosomal protein L6 [Candidatus Woesearchaeota archaeon]
MKSDIKEEIEIPEGVEVSVAGSTIIVSCGGNRAERRFTYPKVSVGKNGNSIVFSSKKATKREKMMINTFKAHLRNMFRGVKDGYVYRLMICSSHFPMSVSVDNEEVVIKNFLGEKIPRKTRIVNSTKVSIEGNIIVIKSHEKERAGEMAGRIEKMTNIKGRDRRVFQDGCYIIDKAGKTIR